jgi:uncharacterized protein YndB with AHSA1/START domain
MEQQMPSPNALQVATPSDLEIVITRAFHAPRDKVYQCFTTPALLKRWLLGPPGWTMPVCEVDLRIGGGYRHAWRSEGGESMGLTGIFRDIVPNERLVSTELFDGVPAGGETLVELSFAESNGRTTATYLLTYTSPQARDAAIASGMAEGMEMGFQLLEKVLTNEG